MGEDDRSREVPKGPCRGNGTGVEQVKGKMKSRGDLDKKRNMFAITE